MGRVTTKEDLIGAFSEIGLRSGMDVFVHSSMSTLGYVVNGALDVIDALHDTVEERGTVLMPSHTGQLTDPQNWQCPPLEPENVQKVRRHMKPFDRKTTPIRNRGLVPQTFMTYPGVYRSEHPLNSVIARGARAEFYTREHPLHGSEAIDSPIGRLYEANGCVLLMGVSLCRCTAIHLAEFMAHVPYLEKNDLKVLVSLGEGNTDFVRLKLYPGSSENFERVRRDYPDAGEFKEVDLHGSRLTLFQIKPVVDFVVEQLRRNPNYLIGDGDVQAFRL